MSEIALIFNDLLDSWCIFVKCRKSVFSGEKVPTMKMGNDAINPRISSRERFARLVSDGVDEVEETKQK